MANGPHAPLHRDGLGGGACGCGNPQDNSDKEHALFPSRLLPLEVGPQNVILGTHFVHQPGHHFFTTQPLNPHMQALLFFNHLSMAEPVIQEARPKPESTSPAEKSIRSSPTHYSELELQSQTRLWSRGVGTGRLWTRGRGRDRPTAETSSPSAPSTRAVCRPTRGSIGTEATRPSPAVLREGIESNIAGHEEVGGTQCVLYLLERERK